MGSRQSNSRNATNHTATSPTTKEDFDSLGLQMSNVPADFAAQLDGLQRQLEMSERKRSSAEEEVRAPGYIPPHGSLHARAQTRTLTIARTTYRSCASQPHSHARVTWVTAHSLSHLSLYLTPFAKPTRTPHASPPSTPAVPPSFSGLFDATRSRMSHATGMGGLCSARRRQRHLQIALHFRRAASHSLGHLAA
jgi:hypothetical protein